MKQWFLPVVLMLTACQQTQKVTEQTAAQDTAAIKEGWTSAPPLPIGERDTVTIGKVLYNISDIDRAEFDAVPAHTPDPEKEKENILPYAEKVSRQGDSLVLKLDNGKTEILRTNHSDGDDYAEYVFLDYIPSLKAYLVYGQGYEYYDYLLVRASDGVTTHTIGIPQLSPDKRSFICSNADLVAGFTTNGFELFSMVNDTIAPVQERQPESWGPVMIKWKDARIFVAHLQERDAQMNETDRFVMLVPR
ncbi:hypothetical protein [Chitinophaga sp. 22620]|uniref:hypothetical protein n=1 Tax=Chitinophaga sp. 22620 TaxID=3453952 RepID=UPI003F86C9D6